MRIADAPLFSGADSAWWRMEDPTNQMVVTAVLTFDGPIDADALRATLEHKLLAYPRFRRHVAEPPAGIGRPRWAEGDDFSLDHHLRDAWLPEPADAAALHTFVSTLMSTTLDYDRPLWQFHHVRNYETGSALVVRTHHCVADGIALVKLLLSLGDEDALQSGAPAIYANDRPPPTVVPWAWRMRLTGPRGVTGAVRMGGSTAAVLGRLLAMAADPDTLLRGKLTTRKRAAWSRPFVLDDVRFAARALGGTVNDLVLTLVAGALRGYLEQRRPIADGKRVRAIVPVNLRRPGDPDTLGNRFGLVFVPLPVGTADPLERFRAVKRTMDRVKRSPEALVLFGMLELFGRTTKRVEKLAVEFLARNATLIMTNVPGPREPVHLCGRRLKTLMAWVPQSGRVGLGVSIMSYAGKAQLGVAADAQLVPEPDAVIQAFDADLACLLERVGLLPQEVAAT